MGGTVRKVGPGLDPCGAIRVAFELADGQASERIFRLGVVEIAMTHASSCSVSAARGRRAMRLTRSGSIGSGHSVLCR